MNKRNIIPMTDSYKWTHWDMLPAGTTKVYSYLEARKGAAMPSTVFFGLQYLLKEYLEGVRVTWEDLENPVQTARRIMAILAKRRPVAG